jgi:hypothetical protein
VFGNGDPSAADATLHRVLPATRSAASSAAMPDRKAVCLRRMFLQIRVVITALVVTIALVACGGGNGDKTPPTATAQPLTATQILSNASKRMAETTSLRFKLDIDGKTYVDTAGTIRLLEASGELARPNKVHSTFKVRVAGTATLTMEIITIGDKTWSTNLITGKWEQAPDEFSYNPSVLFDKQGGVGPVMDRVTNAKRLEDEKLNGADTYHIRADVTSEVIGPLTADTLTGSPVIVDLWIDQDNFNLLRARLTGVSPNDGKEPVVWTLNLSDHDQPMHIIAPIATPTP